MTLIYALCDSKEGKYVILKYYILHIVEFASKIYAD